MPIYFWIIIFILSCICLIKAGSLTVKILTRISQFLKWKEFIASFILMAFCTSLPELFVGISSAIYKHPELSFANIVGSNIINLSLLVGIGALMAKGLEIESKIAQKDSLLCALILVLPILLILDGRLGRADGIILLLAFILYLWQSFSKKEIFDKTIVNGFRRDKKAFKNFIIDILLFIVSVCLLLISAEGVVKSSTFFAESLNLPLVFLTCSNAQVDFPMAGGPTDNIILFIFYVNLTTQYTNGVLCSCPLVSGFATRVSNLHTNIISPLFNETFTLFIGTSTPNNSVKCLAVCSYPTQFTNVPLLS